ncbi:MAG: hypothetical protein Q8O42_10630 [Acidobacteriota bacterium]|nr:hypothetical protein [Acidobacteriota bacterium]
MNYRAAHRDHRKADPSTSSSDGMEVIDEPEMGERRRGSGEGWDAADRLV